MDETKQKTDADLLRVRARQGLFRDPTDTKVAVKSPSERDYSSEPGFWSLDSETRKQLLKPP